MIIAIYTGKASEKIQMHFIIKAKPLKNKSNVP